MIFAQNNLINYSCLKIPQPTWHCRQHAWSSKQAQTLPISPHRPSFHLYAGGAPNLVNESSLGRRIQKQTLHLKKDCVWAQIYMQPTQPTSTKLPLSIHIFSTIFFLMQIFLFSFRNSITLTLYYRLQRSHSCFWYRLHVAIKIVVSFMKHYRSVDVQ